MYYQTLFITILNCSAIVGLTVWRVSRFTGNGKRRWCTFDRRRRYIERVRWRRYIELGGNFGSNLWCIRCLCEILWCFWCFRNWDTGWYSWCIGTLNSITLVFEFKVIKRKHKNENNYLFSNCANIVSFLLTWSL